MNKKMIMAGAVAFALIGSLTAQAELVGNWNFDGQNLTNSGSTGAIHDGTFSGGVANFSTDTHSGSGHSLQLTGADDDFLRINNSSTGDGASYVSTFDGTAFTVSLWMKTESAWVDWDEIGSKGVEGGASPAGWTLRADNGTDPTHRMWFNDNDDGGTKGALAGSGMFDQSWHLITATYDGADAGNKMKMYVDGVSSKEVSDTLSIGSAYSMVFGARYDGSRGGDVLLDDIQYYDTALNATEVAALAIPEPATLGLVVAFGGGLIFVRRLFQI